MKHYLDKMPLYVAGGLDEAARREMEAHLARCAECRAELSFWQTVAHEIRSEDAGAAPALDTADAALARIRTMESAHPQVEHSNLWILLRGSWMGVIALLKAQAFLIRREMWPAVAAVMGLSVIVALISKQYGLIGFVGPLAAAASLAGMSGPGQDPAFELTAATPTSAWKILLARLSVVSAYNLAIALLASAAMLLILPPDLFGLFILGWLAPMAFLSSLALLLSVWIGTNNAIILAYGLWLLQYLRISIVFNGSAGLSFWNAFISAYQQFWQTPVILFALAAVMLAVTLFSARFTDRRLVQSQI